MPAIPTTSSSKSRASPLPQTQRGNRWSRQGFPAEESRKIAKIAGIAIIARIEDHSCDYDWALRMSFKRPTPTYDEAALYEYAIAALGRRMRTVAEMKRLLRNRVPRDEAGEILVEMIVLRLKEHKYLNDSNYATTYSAFRRDNEK